MISKYTLLQTLPDLITILSCMSLLFLFPSSSLSHCLSPSSDYLLSLSPSPPFSLQHFLAHKSWKLRSEGWCCWKPWYKATTLSQMKTLLWHEEAGEHPVHIPPYVSASGSSILLTCVHGCYPGSNIDETCGVVISELKGAYIHTYINIYIYTVCFTADSILEYCRADLGKCFLSEKNNLNADWTFAFTFWFLLIFHSSVVSPHGSG